MTSRIGISLQILRDGSGFTLPEFLISSLILLLLSSAVFGMLSDVQRAAASQAEVQSVLENSQVALQTVVRYVRQAANDPVGSGLAGIGITSENEIHIRSDLTGSLGSANPDKGDPDGDLNDSGENVTIRYNKSAKTLEVVLDGGTAQIIASNISDFSLQYYDAEGNTTTVGSQVRKIRVSIFATSQVPDPRTRKSFGMQVSSDIFIAT
jgi:prepilin-type N-terminal cleavage/methylation domain-containing protein